VGKKKQVTHMLLLCNKENNKL